ncbi:MAG: DUF2934 domain-containing protein [Acidisphaera sp.]|nr:DUF2934 domain-containing protein [Acidisphaera sp.]
MSDNPLEDTPERLQRIRERAYHLWQADGSPHGRDLEYWERARELIGMEENPGAGQLPATQEPVIEEADIQENLGEFPDRFADQGERQPTPTRRRRKAE